MAEAAEASTPVNDAPNAEARAREQGWLPKEEFKGPETRWVDAETYLERGEQIAPILRKNRDELQRQLRERDGRIAELERKVSEGEQSMEGLRKYHEEDAKRRVEQARTNLVKELRDAREQGDTDKEVEILGAINRLDAPPKEEVKKEEPKKAQYSPDFLAWVRENSWFDAPDLGQRGDSEKTARAIAEGNYLSATRKELTGRDFLDEVKKRVQDIYPELGNGRRDIPSRVEGSRGGASQGSGGSGRNFADLPAEAKSACHSDAERFNLVGQSRAFKSMKQWEEQYARDYFGE